MVLPNEHISPWHVLLDYVRVTAPFTKPGEPVLIGLKPPYAPICANTVTSITKEALLGLGLDLGEDGAHTTRGAFVGFYKYLELPSEVVAELGQWANLEAVGKHYLRLGAVDQAAQPQPATRPPGRARRHGRPLASGWLPPSGDRHRRLRRLDGGGL